MTRYYLSLPDPKTARGSDGDANAGESAGPCRRRDQIEPCEIEPRLVHHLGDHRHQRFGMAARHQRLARKQAARPASLA